MKTVIHHSDSPPPADSLPGDDVGRVAENIVDVRSILTRCSGYLSTISSHSLNPYRGCALGNALCGVGCYVRSSIHVTRGQRWGSFVEVRRNAAEVYRSTVVRERAWARRTLGSFSIFFSSVTEPFQPAERRHRITRALLMAMADASGDGAPDELILQTHSHHVTDEVPTLIELSKRCRLRVHVSIETDRERLPGLPPPTSSVAKRLAACAALKRAGVRTVVTVAPLLPIESPEVFFAKIAEVADAVVIDHYIGGDGSADGARTRRTSLPVAMAQVDPKSVTIDYRDEMAAIAERILPGWVGIGRDGFAGRFGEPEQEGERITNDLLGLFERVDPSAGERGESPSKRKARGCKPLSPAKPV